VVVLAILAALAATASVGTEQFLMQQRFEITQDSLDSARVAVLGASVANDAAGSPVAGFVADCGRLPLAVGDNTAASPNPNQLAELWANPGLVPYQLQQSPVDPEVWLGCGWRGPYLRLPTGGAGLHDGWGRPFVAITTDAGGRESAAANGEPIMGLASFGSDGTAGVSLTGPTPWSVDLTTRYFQPAPALEAHWLASLQVRVWQRDALGDKVAPSGAGTLTVRLFLPNGTTGAISHADASLPGPLATIPTVTFPQVPIGPKVLRAYWALPDGSVLKSQPLPVELTRTGARQWELSLPYVAPAPPPSTP
jgi:hypothetical protein